MPQQSTFNASQSDAARPCAGQPVAIRPGTSRSAVSEPSPNRRATRLCAVRARTVRHGPIGGHAAQPGIAATGPGEIAPNSATPRSITTKLAGPLCSAIAILLSALATTANAEEIAPGVVFRTYNLGHPNVVYVLAVDRSRAEYKLQIGWPQGVRNFESRAPTSAIAQFYDNPPAHDVLAAVNGSFYGTIPDIIGATASDGQMLESPGGAYETVIINPGHTATIAEDIHHEPGQLVLADGTTSPVHAYNHQAAANQITAYTPTWGRVSIDLPPAGLCTLIIHNASYPMRAQKEISGIVAAILSGPAARENDVPPDGLVLVADGPSADSIRQHVFLGDRLRIRFDASSTALNNVQTAITGIGWVVHAGAANTANWQQYNYSSVRHPRTVLAWNDSHWYLMVVDGRSEASLGMTFAELADFLVNTLQVREAVNLDGGGSSTMVVDGSVRNVPSDGTERSVSNAVLLVRADTRSRLPFADSFTASGRAAGWDDKFTYNDVLPIEPPAPQGDGYALEVCDPAGGVETIRRGDWGDVNYAVQADILCTYRPDAASSGFERYGIFARDSGTGAFGLGSYGGGNCYALTYDSDDGRIRAGVIVEGALSDFLADVPIHEPSTAWRRFRIDCFSSTIRYWVDGEVIAEVCDGTHAQGFFGLGYHEFLSDNGLIWGTRADNFSVTRSNSDFDDNGRVDIDDMLRLVFCMLGPDDLFVPGHFCTNADFDGDRDIDLRDLAMLQRVFTGP